MKRQTIFLSLLFFFSGVGLSFADKVYLKTGEVVEGKIVEQNAYYTIIHQGEIPQKFFASQIDRVEEVNETLNNSQSQIPSKIPNISQQKFDLIMRLMDVNGIKSNMKDNITKIIAQTPENKRAEVEGLLKLDEILEALAPVFDKYYSEEELQELISFYDSPVGKKFLIITPQLMTEALQASLKYFQGKNK